MSSAKIFFKDRYAGILEESDTGYRFHYDNAYLESDGAQPVSLTLPLTNTPYESPDLFPFFDGLIPEGWLVDIATRTANISLLDRFALLLLCCRDCIGAVSVVGIPDEEDIV